MDIKARSKAANIIFSILIFLLTSFMFASFIFPQLTPSLSEFNNTLTTKDLVTQAVELIKTYSKTAPSDISYIPEYISIYGASYVYLIILAVTLIILLVNYIIVLVRTIQGLAGKDVNRALIKHILMMISASMTYVAVFLGIFYSRHLDPASGYSDILPGYGLLGLVGACIILFVICAIIKISRDDNKRPASRVLKIIISFLSIISSAIFFMAIFNLHNNAPTDSTANLIDGMGLIIYYFASFIKGGSGTPNQTLYASIALLSLPFLFAAQATFNKMIVGSFELETDKDDKAKLKDVGGGLIAKCVIAFIFTGAGAFLIPYALKTLVPANNFEMSYTMYAACGIGLVCFVLSIIHKVNSKELKEEVKKGTSSTPKLEVEKEPKEKTPAVEIEPAEEVMDEGNVNNLDKESPIDKLGISIDDLMKK